MEVISANGITVVKITTTQSVPTEHNTAPSKFREFAVGNRIFRGSQIESNTPGASLKKVTVGHRAFGHVSEAHHAGWGVVHLPVVLNTFTGEAMEAEATAMGESNPFAQKVIELLEDPELVKHQATQGARAWEQLSKFGKLRGRGHLLALARPGDAVGIVKLGLEKGILLNAPNPDTLRLMPALNTSVEVWEQAMGLLGEVIP